MPSQKRGGRRAGAFLHHRLPEPLRDKKEPGRAVLLTIAESVLPGLLQPGQTMLRMPLLDHSQRRTYRTVICHLDLRATGQGEIF